MIKAGVVAVALAGILMLSGCGYGYGKGSDKPQARQSEIGAADSVTAVMAEPQADNDIQMMASARDGGIRHNGVQGIPAQAEPAFRAQELKGNWQNSVKMEAEIDPQMLEY